MHWDHWDTDVAHSLVQTGIFNYFPSRSSKRSSVFRNSEKVPGLEDRDQSSETGRDT